MKLSIFIVVVMFAILGQTRHIHPGGIDPDEITLEEINVVDTDIPIDVLRNMKMTRFVPINSVLFFKTYEPCEDGFKRDALGICREVWN